MKIFFAAGAVRAHAPASRSFFLYHNDRDRVDELVRPEWFKLGQVSISAAHLMGGCRMGIDPGSSVTDPWGRVHGKRGLYVADASLFPDSVEINPYLTIMALADRVAEAVRKDTGAK
jgi:choline dehydrogenase-like flavoprotein